MILPARKEVWRFNHSRAMSKTKDGVFASSLLVEMISVTGRKLSEMLDEIYARYGYSYTGLKVTANLKLQRSKRCTTKSMFRNNCQTLNLKLKKSATKMVLRFTSKMVVGSLPASQVLEPLLRIFAEMEDKTYNERVLLQMKTFCLCKKS